MFSSFRRRILAWQALTLIAVVGAFASLLYWNTRSSRLGEVDSQLLGGAQLLAAAIRSLPPSELSGEPPPLRDPPRDRPRHAPEEDGDSASQAARRDPLPEPPGDRPFYGRRRPPPRRPPPEDFQPPSPEATRRHVARVLGELELPESLQPPPDDPAGPAYFLIWRGDGELLKASPSAPKLATGGLPRELFDGEYRYRRRGDIREVVLGGPDLSLIVVGRPIGREYHELNQLVLRLAAIGAAVAAAGMFGAALLARHVVRPVEAMSATAAAISADNLSARIDPATFDLELQSLARTLNGAFARLEQAFERQSRFTADASHELRTPLAVLSSHLEFALSRGSLEPEQRETLEACRRAVRRMNSLVDALLLLARADAGDLALVRQPCDLASTVEECVEMLRPLAAEKSVSLELSADVCDLEADPALLGQLVMNLLTNAIHYNRPGGSVQVAVRTEQDAAVLVVEDTGPGIAPQDQSHLFERFYRVDKARSREEGGNGLGLAIVKSIVDAHQGEICVASRPGQGARFTVRLPLNAGTEATA